MPYITREDGERFVIPSYRDVISAKKQSLLKREIILLSQNYGEYITLHRKNVEQYEVAFSPDTGYLLGETVWHYFKRPLDLIYCEAIPNSSEAILVIVKSGSVYLDGSFSVDAIPDELVIFRTQQNNFDIYIYGEVPISSSPEDGYFTFDPASVRSFQVLDEPVFPKLPKVKNFQLQLVDTVLKSRGIGVFPIRKVLTVIIVLGLLYVGYTWLTTTYKKELPTAFVSYVNPYQVFLDTLTSPDPSDEIQNINNKIELLYRMPGWVPETLEYSKGKLHVSVRSNGTKAALMFAWARASNATIQVLPDGFYLNWLTVYPTRSPPKTIYKLNDVIGTIVDRLNDVVPGNNLVVGQTLDKRMYLETSLTINFANITPNIFNLIGLQLRNLPLVLNKATITIMNGQLSGVLILQVLGY